MVIILKKYAKYGIKGFRPARFPFFLTATRRLRDDDDGKMRLRSGQSSGETVREIISCAR